MPLAKEGLIHEGLDIKDINKYLNVIEQRTKSKQTGAKWAIKSISKMPMNYLPDEKVASITAAMMKNQKRNKPVHQWELAKASHSFDWRTTTLRVGQFMTENLFTVKPDDLLDLAESIMNWENLKHVLVENKKGELVGLISQRILVREVKKGHLNQDNPLSVKDVMIENIITVTPETLTVDAISLMREKKLGYLPIISNKKLVGIITDYDLLTIASDLLVN